MSPKTCTVLEKKKKKLNKSSYYFKLLNYYCFFFINLIKLISFIELLSNGHFKVCLGLLLKNLNTLLV